MVNFIFLMIFLCFSSPQVHARFHPYDGYTAPQFGHLSNSCERRLFSKVRNRYTYNHQNVAPELQEIHANLFKYLKMTPTSLREFSPNQLNIRVADYIEKLLKFRTELHGYIHNVNARWPQNHFLSSSLLQLEERLKLTQEREKKIKNLFNPYSNWTLYQLKSRKIKGLNKDKHKLLIKQLEQITSHPRGYLSEFVIGLQQNQLKAISVRLGNALRILLPQKTIELVCRQYGVEYCDYLMQLEIDILAESPEAFVFAEVKNSVQYAYTYGPVQDQYRQKVFRRIQRLQHFLKNFESYLNKPIQLHYFFNGPGANA
ncbi:MAG: hypothetical protein KDD40_07135, partial [Bdellovibrionales bacterium]|nr:hypothetical protein [Bdellovibrionales bacterium]